MFQRFPIDSDEIGFASSLRRLEHDDLTDTHSAESYRPQVHSAWANLIVSDRCRRMDLDRTVQLKNTQLFWPQNTDRLDEFIQERSKEKKASTAAAKAGKEMPK